METWILVAVFAFLASGIIKGTLGVGLPIAAVGLMTLFIDARLAIALMVFPIMFTNVWQFYRSGAMLEIAKRYWVFALVLAVTMWTTTLFTTQVSVQLLVAMVGIVIILFSVTNLAFNPPPIPPEFDRIGQFAGGLAAGVLGGLTAIWSPPVAAYMIASGVEKDEFVGSTGFLFLVGSLPLCIGFWNNGMLTGPVALVSAGMIVPTLAGFSIGEILRRKLKPERFKTLVLVFFLLIGLNLVRRAVFEH